MAVPALRSDKMTYLVDQKDLGRADSLRYNVISLVREEQYDRACTYLIDFLDRPSDFPALREKIERYIEHSQDLVRAIEMKRNFPGSKGLTSARQQDLKLKAKQHIDELVYCLKKVEQVEFALRVEDVRSTIIVVHAVVLCSFAIAVVAFVIELSRGLLLNTVVVLDDLFQTASHWLMNYL